MDDFLSPEHAAVLHLLTAPVVWPRAAPYLHGDDVDWAGLAAESETMSGGASLLVRTASDLWHAERTVGVWEVPRRLDHGNFGRVLEALRICRNLPLGLMGRIDAGAPALREADDDGYPVRLRPAAGGAY